MDSFVDLLTVIIDYFLKMITRLQSQPTSQPEISNCTIIILHAHLAYKLIRKHHHLNNNPPEDLEIYKIMYAIDYALSESITYQYKRMNTKTKEEALDFIKNQLTSFILEFNEQNIEEQCGISDKKIKK